DIVAVQEIQGDPIVVRNREEELGRDDRPQAEDLRAADGHVIGRIRAVDDQIIGVEVGAGEVAGHDDALQFRGRQRVDGDRVAAYGFTGIDLQNLHARQRGRLPGVGIAEKHRRAAGADGDVVIDAWVVVGVDVRVRARAPVDRVGAARGKDRVVARAGVDVVGRRTAGYRVVAGAAEDRRIDRGGQIDDVVAGAAVHDLGDRQSGEGDIVAAAPA